MTPEKKHSTKKEMIPTARILRAAAACIFLPAAFAAFLLIFSCDSACAWGWRTHEMINRRAVELLPEPAHAAWSPLAAQLAAHANDADDRKNTSRVEPPLHFIDIDVYGSPPFDTVSHDRQVLEREHGVDSVRRRGLLPWAVEETYAEVVSALRTGDWALAGIRAADLGHYVADAHQPLHCTKNFDGQLTGNKGVHLLFEATMLDRFLEESMLAATSTIPEMEGAPVDLCFGWVSEAYGGIDTILAADHEARALDPNLEDRYIERLWQGSREVATRQIGAAARDFAVLLQAAWIEGGRPAQSTSAQAGSDSTRSLAVWQERAARPEEPEDRLPIGLTLAGIATGVFLVMFFVKSN